MANTELLQQYLEHRKKTDVEFLKMVNSPLYFNIYLMTTLPMGWLAGLRVKSCTGKKCEITVPYKWLNKNPFKSTYFAVLSMAAEMSTGMPAVMLTHNSKPSVSMLVTHLEADFVKKATGITTFTCTDSEAMAKVVEECVLTGEPRTFSAVSEGRSATGEVEARFVIQWSFKARMPK